MSTHTRPNMQARDSEGKSVSLLNDGPAQPQYTGVLDPSLINLSSTDTTPATTPTSPGSDLYDSHRTPPTPFSPIPMAENSVKSNEAQNIQIEGVRYGLRHELPVFQHQSNMQFGLLPTPISPQNFAPQYNPAQQAHDQPYSSSYAQTRLPFPAYHYDPSPAMQPHMQSSSRYQPSPHSQYPAFPPPAQFPVEAPVTVSARETSEKKYPCKHADSHQCTRLFTTSGHASRHAKNHTNPKSITCTHAGCPKKFTRADNMKQHLSTHNKDKSGRGRSSRASSVLTRDSGIRKNRGASSSVESASCSPQSTHRDLPVFQDGRAATSLDLLVHAAVSSERSSMDEDY